VRNASRVAVIADEEAPAASKVVNIGDADAAALYNHIATKADPFSKRYRRRIVSPTQRIGSDASDI
jgi:hypothetical protein